MAYSKVHSTHAELTENGIVRNLTVVRDVTLVSNSEKEAGEAPADGRTVLLEIDYDGMTIEQLAEEAARKSVIDIQDRFRSRTELHEVRAILDGMQEQPHPKRDETVLTTTYRVQHGTEAYFSGPKSEAEREQMMEQSFQEMDPEKQRKWLQEKMDQLDV